MIMTTRSLIVTTLVWAVFAVGISAGLIAVIAPLANRVDRPEAIWAVVGAGILFIVLAPLLWLVMRWPKGTAS